MSRGRKRQTNNSEVTREIIFKRNAGSYFKYLILELANDSSYKSESAKKLLNQIGRLSKKALPTIVNSEKPFAIPSGWAWCRLGEISINCDGDRIPISQSEREKREKIYDYYGASGVIDKIDSYTHDGKFLLIGEDGANLKAKSTPIAFIVEGKFWVNNHAHVLQFKHDITYSYMEYCLNAIDISNFITGGFQPKLSQGNLNLIPIPLPPLEEQDKIVRFLNDLKKDSLKSPGFYFNSIVEQKIVELHQSQLSGADITTEVNYQLGIVKKLRQQLLQDAVQGKLVPQDEHDEPASELLKKIKAEKAKDKKYKELPAIKAEEIPFEIPGNWVWCRLGDLCSKIGSGSTPKGSNYSDSGIPFFRSQNIYDSGLVYEDIKFISSSVHKEMNGTIVYPQDILLNITGGSMGRCAYVSGEFSEGNVSQHVCIIRPIGVNNQFFHKVVLSPYFQAMIFSSTTGAGREGLPKYNLEQFLVPLPPFEEQKRIMSKSEQLMLTCDELEASIKESKTQNEQLLRQVLREALRQPEEMAV